MNNLYLFGVGVLTQCFLVNAVPHRCVTNDSPPANLNTLLGPLVPPVFENGNYKQ